MKLLKKLFIFPVIVYQYTLGQFMGGRCRFEPSCSNYMIEAINEWGPFKGTILGLKRIGRCHPWGKCGPDPVPKNPKNVH